MNFIWKFYETAVGKIWFWLPYFLILSFQSSDGEPGLS